MSPIDVQHALQMSFLMGLLMLTTRTAVSQEDDEFAGGLMQSRTTGNWLEIGRCRKTSCHVDAECIESMAMRRRTHRCRCKAGFYGNGRVCIDDDECERNNGGCVHRCENTRGSFTCSCHDGFQLAPDRRHCIDIDECSSPSSTTSSNFRHGLQQGARDVINRCSHRCDNTVGGYTCRCPSGQSVASDGRTCIAGSWCRDHFGCAHHCQTRAGVTQCACRVGYRLHPNGKDCIISCSHGNGGCQHLCAESPTSVTCSCRMDYLLAEDKRSCTATCRVQNGGCQHLCRDSAAGPLCSCSEGFIPHPTDPKTCLDIDECDVNNGGCSDGCLNTVGDYECTCPDGYRVDTNNGTTCLDVNECAWHGTCEHICINTDGGFTCHCEHGYQLYGITHCADMDECSVNNGDCQQTCVNTVGSYHCRCADNYTLHINGRDCVALQSPGPCRQLKAPPKSTLSCQSSLQSSSASTSFQTCRVQCPPDAATVAMSSSANVGDVVTACGPTTNYRWTHDTPTADGTLLGCSDLIVAPLVESAAKFAFIASRCSRSKSKNVHGIERQIASVIQICDGTQNGSLAAPLRCTSRLVVQNLTCRSAPPRYRRRHRTTSRDVGDVKRRRGQDQVALVTVEFQLLVQPVIVSADSSICDVTCWRKRGSELGTQLRGVVKRLRGATGSGLFTVQYDGAASQVLRGSFKAESTTFSCNIGYVLVGGLCVGCPVSSYYNVGSGECVPCPPGQYQPEQGRLTCISRHSPRHWDQQPIACPTNDIACNDICVPGSHSSSGFRPCEPCPGGTYQSDFGRMGCVSCGTMTTDTSSVAATSFRQCLHVTDVCAVGHYYSRSEAACQPCPVDTYQWRSGLDYCIRCPQDTHTDSPGSVSASQCKSHQCYRIESDDIRPHQPEQDRLGPPSVSSRGFLQSPNWPGHYPRNVRCSWTIGDVSGGGVDVEAARGSSRRRLLVVVTEVFLGDETRRLNGECGATIGGGDSLIVTEQREAASPGGRLGTKPKRPLSADVLYNICHSIDTPIAFTSRPGKVNVTFRTDGTGHGKGFSLGYVSYSDEFHELITDIISDKSLYTSHQHRQLLKDRRLLSGLMEVIENPSNYFKYAAAATSDSIESAFPDSFVRLLRAKVVRFFSRNQR